MLPNGPRRAAALPPAPARHRRRGDLGSRFWPSRGGGKRLAGCNPRAGRGLKCLVFRGIDRAARPASGGGRRHGRELRAERRPAARPTAHARAIEADEADSGEPSSSSPAGLLVVHEESFPFVDLRIDLSPRPLGAKLASNSIDHNRRNACVAYGDRRMEPVEAFGQPVLERERIRNDCYDYGRQRLVELDAAQDIDHSGPVEIATNSCPRPPQYLIQ